MCLPNCIFCRGTCDQWPVIKGVQEIMHTYIIIKRVGKKTLYYKTNQHFKDLYDKIYTIGY
jgi:hypothetical protein